MTIQDSFRLLSLRVLSIALLMAQTLTAHPWDASRDFSSVRNPNGVWSYGYLDRASGDFKHYSTPNASHGAAKGWQDRAINFGGQLIKNGSDGPVENGCYYAVGQLILHPGADEEKTATLRWLAPRAVIVKIRARFSGLNYGQGTTTDVSVFFRGRSLFEGRIAGFAGGGQRPVSGESPQREFSRILTVQRGDVIDFAVGAGGNGYFSDSTGIDVLIAEVSAEIGTVRGTVSADLDDALPLGGVRVRDRDGELWTETAVDGTFSLMLPAKRYTLELSRSGFPTREIELDVAADSVTTRDLKLSASMVTGRITSKRGGQGVDLARLKLTGSRFSTDARVEGSYALIVPPGRYSLSVSSHRHEPENVEIELVGGKTLSRDFELGWMGLTPMTSESHERALAVLKLYPERRRPGVDLLWHMDRTIEYMLNIMDRDRGGLPYSSNRIYFAPPRLKHVSADSPHNLGRHVLAMMIYEEASGQRVPDDSSVSMLRSLLHDSFSAEDHLSHAPKGSGGEHTEMHSRREVLLSLLGLATVRGDQRSVELARSMVRAFAEEERLGHIAMPMVSGRLIRALVQYHRLTGDPLGLEFAQVCADEAYEQVCDDDGRITHGHMHSTLGTLSGLVEFGLYTNQARYVERARLAIDRGIPVHRSSYGFFYETDLMLGRGEANNPADLVRSQILLGLNGHPEYFDDVERIVRNHLLASQFLDPGLAGSSHDLAKTPPDSATELYTGAARRLCGGFAYTTPNDLIDAQFLDDFDMASDMASGALEGLAAIWKHIITRDKSGLHVHLLFSRESEALDVRSHIPVVGRVELVIKQPQDVYVRIPAYARPDKFRVTVDGQELASRRLFGPYVLIPSTAKPATAVIDFKQVELICRETLNGNPAYTPGEKLKVEYTQEWLGDTLWNMVPAGERVPLYFPARLALYGVK